MLNYKRIYNLTQYTFAFKMHCFMDSFLPVPGQGWVPVIPRGVFEYIPRPSTKKNNVNYNYLQLLCKEIV